MLRPATATLAIVVSVTAPSVAQQSAQPAPPRLFRHVALARDTVWLGEPLGALVRYARTPSDSIVTVPLGEFGGADAIQVRRRPDGTVYSVLFLYGALHDMEQLRDEYIADLGAPADSATDSVAGVVRRSWVWQDEDTAFQLVAFSAPLDGAVGGALMLDRRRRAPQLCRPHGSAKLPPSLAVAACSP